MTATFEGLDEFRASVQDAIDAMVTAGKQALYRRAETIMTDSKMRCPVDTGNLRSTGMVTPEDDGATVVLSYGGSAAPYAIYVHERLDVHHPVGEAKFLESAFLEGTGDLADYLASEMRAALR